MRNAVGHQSAKYISEAGDDPTPTTQDTELDNILIKCYHAGSMGRGGKTIHSGTVSEYSDLIHQWAERKYGERETEIRLDEVGRIPENPYLDENGELIYKVHRRKELKNGRVPTHLH